MKKVVSIVFALVLQTGVYAQNMLMPETIELFGDTYSAAYKPRDTFREFTTNNESVQNWTKLVTLIASNTKTDATRYNAAFEKSLPMKEVAKYTYESDQEQGYFLVIYKPTRQYKYYEAMLGKSFHIPECEGDVVLQYAFKKVALEAISPEEDKKNVEDLMNQLQSYKTILQKQSWKPTCK